MLNEFHRLREIPRADDLNKFLSEKALLILIDALRKLERKKIITYNNFYLTKYFTKCTDKQNYRIIMQLSDILTITMKQKDEKRLVNIYELKKNTNTISIIEDPIRFYEMKAAKNKEEEKDNFMKDLEKKELIDSIEQYDLYTKNQRAILKHLILLSINSRVKISVLSLSKCCKLTQKTIYQAIQLFVKEKIIKIDKTINNKLNSFLLLKEKLDEIQQITKNTSKLIMD